jgi:glycosyltransferase involved in cell wall biosynthesis
LADICILTSKSEGLPVVHEYGKAIKPVLVTDVGEIPAVVQNGKTVLSSRKRKSCFMQLL